MDLESKWIFDKKEDLSEIFKILSKHRITLFEFQKKKKICNGNFDF